MARRTAHYHDDSATVDLTPLLNIIFIMLIFFVVMVSFERQKNAAAEEEIAATTSPPLLLSVEESGFVRVNDARIIDPLTTASVAKEYCLNEPHGLVLIGAAERAKSGVSVDVLNRAMSVCGASRVSLTLERGLGGY